MVLRHEEEHERGEMRIEAGHRSYCSKASCDDQRNAGRPQRRIGVGEIRVERDRAPASAIAWSTFFCCQVMHDA